MPDRLPKQVPGPLSRTTSRSPDRSVPEDRPTAPAPRYRRVLAVGQEPTGAARLVLLQCVTDLGVRRPGCLSTARLSGCGSRVALDVSTAKDDEEASEPPVDGVLRALEAEAAKRQFKPLERTALERSRATPAGTATAARSPRRCSTQATQTGRPASNASRELLRSKHESSSGAAGALVVGIGHMRPCCNHHERPVLGSSGSGPEGSFRVPWPGGRTGPCAVK